MKKNILDKKVLGTDWVKQNPTTGIIVHNLKDTMLNPMNENALTVAKNETKRKIQPLDEFLYSGRCYCGIY